jgi:glyoxylase-like metal-dependent hydrolase (beta-lactamase superfamily II)
MAFPDFVAFTYLLVGGCEPTLVDTGSGWGDSNDALLAGLQAVHDEFSEAVKVEDIKRILITHGHIDHHGGLSFIREQAHGADVGIHPLDRRILVAYEERLVVATKNLRTYLQRAGISDKSIEGLLEVYGFAKKMIKSEKVDFLLTEDLEIDGLRFYHTPGHCPGQVCIQVGDVLLSADHVLAKITPHQAPESITHYTGLGHYLESLAKIKKVAGIRLALGGHKAPITDMYGRIDDIKADHMEKIGRIMDMFISAGQPLTVSDVSKLMYPEVSGYQVLLALEEVGAHVEYLYERGELAVANLKDYETEVNPAIYYSPI